MAEEAMTRVFPPELDIPWYRRLYCNPDASDDEVRRRFRTRGIAAGESSSPLAAVEGFSDWLNERFRNRDILEIGPGAMPRMTGPFTRYFDLRSRDELLAWAKKHHYNEARVPAKIHYVGNAGDFDMVDRKFDLVFSSHNIEHCQDLIRYLNGIEELLKPEGIAALIIPNKLYTLDHYRRLSSLADVVEQYECRGNSETTPLGILIEQSVCSTHNDISMHWKGDHGRPPANVDIKSIVNFSRNHKGWRDCRRWVFTPDSFADIIAALSQNGYIGLKIMRLWQTPAGSNSFNVLLNPSASDNIPEGIRALEKSLAENLPAGMIQVLLRIVMRDPALHNDFGCNRAYDAHRLLLWAWHTGRKDYPELAAHEDEIRQALQTFHSRQYGKATNPAYTELLHGIWLSRRDLQKWDTSSSRGQDWLVRWLKEWGIKEYELESLFEEKHVF